MYTHSVEALVKAALAAQFSTPREVVTTVHVYTRQLIGSGSRRSEAEVVIVRGDSSVVHDLRSWPIKGQGENLVRHFEATISPPNNHIRLRDITLINPVREHGDYEGTAVVVYGHLGSGELRHNGHLSFDVLRERGLFKALEVLETGSIGQEATLRLGPVGLKPGDAIITSEIVGLKPGTSVRTIEASDVGGLTGVANPSTEVAGEEIPDGSDMFVPDEQANESASVTGLTDTGESQGGGSIRTAVADMPPVEGVVGTIVGHLDEQGQIVELPREIGESVFVQNPPREGVLVPGGVEVTLVGEFQAPLSGGSEERPDGGIAQDAESVQIEPFDPPANPNPGPDEGSQTSDTPPAVSDDEKVQAAIDAIELAVGESSGDFAAAAVVEVEAGIDGDLARSSEEDEQR